MFVQLTDLHLTETGELPSGVPVRENLAVCLRAIMNSGLRPEALVLTGDLTNAGERAAYVELRAAVDDAASRLSAQVVYVMGNHDDRAAFRELLLDEPPNDEPINGVHALGDLRLITLDSAMPGRQEGMLSAETLEFLARELAAPASDGTVVALHHPPVATPITPMAAMALTNPDSLREVIEGTDVRLVICGHNHHAAASTIGGSPLWVSPATSYLADATSTRVFRGVPGSAVTRIDVGDGVLVTPISVAPA